MRSPLPRSFALAAAAAAAVFVSLAPAATRGWQPGETSVREAQNRVALGLNHSCVALYDGTVRCWGNNLLGQLGNNTTVNSTLPVTVLRSAVSVFRPAPPLGSVIAVAAGTAFSCALTADGSVSCWGRNDSGQLGDLTNINKARAVSVFNLSGVVRIAAGDEHTCALLANGTVKCWGRNQSGQLGNGNTSNAFSPASVSGLTGVIDIAAGSNHTCAVIAGGTVKCWGSNLFGQLGTANNTNSLTPVAVFNLADAYALTAGGEHTCAITANLGVTQCWGRNTDGQLGNGDFTSRPTPVVAIQTNITSIRAGRAHTCAVTSTGLVRCWGRNAAGQLGNGNTIVQPVPSGGNGLSLMIAAAAGGDHSCAMKADGTMSCWGEGSFGQLGNGAAIDVTLPVAVTGIAGGVSAKAIAAATTHTCALRANGTVACWGNNTQGALGTNSGLGNLPNPTPVNGLTGVVALSANGIHTCAIRADGALLCWGFNGFGEVGNGSTAIQTTPVTVAGVSDAVAVSLGINHTCAVTVTGTAFCWGRNDHGELAINGDTQNRLAPVQVSSFSKLVGLSAGGQFTCGWRVDGAMFCWGIGLFGQMGNGSTALVNTVPVNVPGLPEITSVAAGMVHACAIDRGGVARCWGANGLGQIGNGSSGPDQLLPAAVAGLVSGIQFSGGGQHTCAMSATGAISCWGGNSDGALGLGTADNFPHPAPATVPGVTGVVAIASAGSQGFNCAMRADGGLQCWGDNKNGQIGNGTTQDQHSPVEVPSFTP